MPTKQRGASGEIELEYYWRESGSGHREQTTETRLIGRDKTVELVITSSDDNAIKATRQTGGERYSIAVEKLIELIKTHGENLPRAK